MEYQQGRDSQGNKHDKLSSHFFQPIKNGCCYLLECPLMFNQVTSYEDISVLKHTAVLKCKVASWLTPLTPYAFKSVESLSFRSDNECVLINGCEARRSKTFIK